MNKNSRKSNGDIRQTHPNRNNINILINFNMKDKSQGCTGKKIQNHAEVEQKIPNKIESQISNLEQGKKAKKKGKDIGERLEKQKLFQTPIKQKPAQYNKIIKNMKQQKTPQRHSHSRKDERSKSTNHKLRKRKNATSAQNIKLIKYEKNKSKSPSSSAQKSRSHSKNRKKVMKSQKQSLKNLYAFTNSNIKNSISKSKVNNSREKPIYNQVREEDHHKITKFIQEKKKKQKIQKERLIKEEQLKKNKIAHQLRKVEIERKANASKSFIALKKPYKQEQQRIPIYFIDEEEFDEQNSYNTLKKQAEKMIHDSPPPSYPIETIPIEKRTSSDKYRQLSSKKSNTTTKISIVHKYLNGTIKQKQLQELNKQIIKIQAFWRGYQSRKGIYRKLNDQYTRIRYIKNKIDNKKCAFWNQQQNSIIQIEREPNRQIYNSGNSSNIINSNSLANSNNSSNEISTIGGLKPSHNKYQRLSIQFNEGMLQKNSAQQQKDHKMENTSIMKELQKIKLQLQKQNQKFRSLEVQNQFLKENIKVLSLKESREQIVNNSEQNLKKHQFFEIRMPKKIEESAQKQDVSLESFKKQFEVFDCSSPTNLQIEQQFQILKNKNIASVFKKKQLLIEQKYQKKHKMFEKMLKDQILSPRTFKTKNNELSSNKQSQKDQIIIRMEEAKRVVNYMEDISISQAHEQQQNQEYFDIRQSQLEEKDQIQEPITKKLTVLKDNFTNTSPIEEKHIQFVLDQKPKKAQINMDHWNNSQSSEEQKIYKKYWADDIQEVHKQTMQITRKIEEAMRNQSQTSSAKVQSDSSKYNSLSQGYDSQKYRESDLSQKQKSNDDLNLEIRKNYDEINQEQSQAKRRAQKIFNRVDLSEENECKSQEQDNISHGEIINLLNNHQGIPTEGSTGIKKEQQNTYISEVQFNKKKRKEEELSRSSSFEKSNKSISVNSSQVQSKGFATNLTFIKQFCISVCQFIQNHEQHKQNFILNVSESIKYDFHQYLRAYRTTIEGQVSSRYNTFQEQYLYPYFRIIANKIQPITKELFVDFLQYYEEDNVNNPRWNGQNLSKNTRELRQFFMISIIDAFNQSLEFQKPGSVYGKPLPWLHHSKGLKNHKNTQLKLLVNSAIDNYNYAGNIEDYPDSQMRLDQLFGSSIAKLIQWGGFLCGFIADPSVQMGESQVANLSDSQLNSIRENRVGLMLQKWLVQQQQNMTNSLSEYTEVLLCLGQKIIELLIYECAEQISKFDSVDILDD